LFHHLPHAAGSCAAALVAPHAPTVRLRFSARLKRQPEIEAGADDVVLDPAGDAEGADRRKRNISGVEVQIFDPATEIVGDADFDAAAYGPGAVRLRSARGAETGRGDGAFEFSVAETARRVDQHAVERCADATAYRRQPRDLVGCRQYSGCCRGALGRRIEVGLDADDRHAELIVEADLPAADETTEVFAGGCAQGPEGRCCASGRKSQSGFAADIE